MCKFCWTVVAVLSLITTGIAYKFIVQGKVVEVPDGRTAILLEKGERDLVLSEMRVFLQSVQQITSGIIKDDMESVNQAAGRSGRNAQMQVPGSLIGKLPLGFKKLGFDTHAKFDAMALNADQMGDTEQLLLQLNAVLENCVACHTAYKFEIDTSVSN